MSAPPAPVLRVHALSKTEPLNLLLSLRNYINQHLAEPFPVEFTPDGSQPAHLVLKPAGEEVTGTGEIIRKLLDLYAAFGVAGKDAHDSGEISNYVDTAAKLPTLSFAEVGSVADDLDQHLALRSFLVGTGHALTAADIIIWASFKTGAGFTGLIKANQHKHLARWASYIESLPLVAQTQEDLRGARSTKAKGPGAAKSSGFDVFLPGAKKGQVVTRFPPEPSGYLHLGHTKAAILNSYFAKEYEGRLIVRFDDTNPSKEKTEFQDAIIEDLALLGIKPDSTSHTSDYFDHIYKLAIQLIKQGDAYADDTLQEEMRAQRMDGIASARRNESIEDNLARFADMSAGSEEGRKWCLRAKMSVDDPNKALRDPVIYRCNAEVSHHRTGTTWKVYPTYDFACPVVDALEGITHALRTNEYRDRNPQYAWMLEKLKLRNVEIWDFGRLNFVYTLLSKRKLQWFVDRGIVTGWDDPRFPTVRGVRRRGMTIENMHNFILATGPSQNVINMEWDSIWAGNKRIIDPIVPRFTALETKDLVKCTISGISEVSEKVLPRHKKNAELGTKTTVFGPNCFIEQVDAASFKDNEEITLMDWGNVYVRSKKLAEDGSVASLEMEAHLDGDFKKTEKKVTWLADAPVGATPRSGRLTEVLLLDYDYLITKKKLEEDDEFEKFVTPVTQFETLAIADSNVSELAEGQSIQFERKGYFILDKAQGKDGKREFIRIPDGREATAQSKNAADDGGTEGRKAAAQAARAKAKDQNSPSDAAGSASASKKPSKSTAKDSTGAAPFKEADAALGSSNMYPIKPFLEDVEIEPDTSKMYKMKPII
ncbi:glutamyl-tRNA synthetase [Ceraceosorus guamensis]|uniref:glutamate--tRNA ligase n=1 Tax=Ceraceosorus guamensis TaxID=1522189 RepID=A0A316VQD7_9BASI|nr:glutamyl-tRNA synthetase [Ceraceosorus guamensis]PWN39540.1 glutamyl-tRNA synthetase [Ceraceosorus guamensis]